MKTVEHRGVSYSGRDMNAINAMIKTSEYRRTIFASGSGYGVSWNARVLADGTVERKSSNHKTKEYTIKTFNSKDEYYNHIV